MCDQEESYLAYLLRLWIVKNQKGYVWRCSVENVQTGERQGFSSPESLCDFIREVTTHIPDHNPEYDDGAA